MKKLRTLLLTTVSLYFFGSCSEEAGKKVLVMASGKVQVNENVITLEPGTTHTENEIQLPDTH